MPKTKTTNITTANCFVRWSAELLLAFYLQRFCQKVVAMKRENVNSSVLKAVGYNEKTKILETELHNKAVYEYYKVAPEEYNDLIAASSLGEYYNKVIKKHKCKKLR